MKGAVVLSEEDKTAAKLRLRAKKYLTDRQWQRAVDTCTEALQFAPHCYKALRLRALAYGVLSQHDLALADVDEVVEAQPNNADGWYQKGYCHYHLKEFIRSARCFHRGLEFNPGDRMLQQGYWDAMNLLSQSRADADPQGGGVSVGDEPLDPLDAPLQPPRLTLAAMSSFVRNSESRQGGIPWDDEMDALYAEEQEEEEEAQSEGEARGGTAGEEEDASVEERAQMEEGGSELAVSEDPGGGTS